MSTPNKNKEALGKGIRALLDSIDTDVHPHSKEPGARDVTDLPIAMIGIDQIDVNPFQPRTNFDEEKLDELAESIKIHGIIQPITVRKISAKKYQLIAGERRLKASRIAGLTELPSFVRIANDEQMLEMALIENTHREDLNAIEIALNYKRLIDECNLTQEDVAEKVSKDRSSVANHLRLLKLPPDIQLALKDKQITYGHARALINIDSTILQLHLFKEIVSKELSVRQVEQLVRDGIKIKEKKKTIIVSITNPQLRKLQDKLTSHLGTKVFLKRSNNGKGEIVISFFSDEDLERIIEIINPG
jgi:ParB family transcriptional regulator, chromosome partitioning protein